jgi:GTP:adenosylcobinamide-phosphate guanylyltransferase
MIAAIVLAGGVDHGDLAAQTGIVHRPLLEVGGRPILLAVLAALRGSRSVGPIVLVGPQAVRTVAADDAVDVRAPEGGTFLQSIAHGVKAAPAGAEHLLLITGDLPLIPAEAVDDFVQRSLHTRAEVCYPIIPKDSCERRFPGGRRTYVRLREGTFTGGNAVLASRAFLERSQNLIGRLYAARKNPLKLAALFGLPFVFGLLTGRLSIWQLEERASAIISGRVAAVISTYAELGFDVDKLEDLEVARRAAGG